MASRHRSLIPFRAADRRVGALDHAVIHHSSAGLGWQGLRLEVGENQGWSVDDVVIDGHYVAFNTADVPLHIERKTLGGFRSEVIGPGELWLQPAGEPFTLRVNQLSCYAGAVLDVDRARSVLSRDVAVEPTMGLADPVIVPLLRALAAEVIGPARAGQIFVEGMTTALAAQLARLGGQEMAAARGGIAPRRLRRVLEHVEAHLQGDLSLDEMAGLAGLSPFHFSRAFKQSTGTTPHRYVLDRRLNRAREMLTAGDRSVDEVAWACGFADQPHLSRAFKARFGVTPGSLTASRFMWRNRLQEV